MKTFLLGLVSLLVLLLPARAQHDFGIFKVTASITVSKVTVNTESFDTVQKKILANNDIINLALGRALGSRVNAKTEILAAACTYEDHGAPPLSTLIICDPTQNGAAQVVVTVGNLSSLEFQNAYESARNTGFGFGVGSILATTKGTPSANGFLATTVYLSASGGGVHLDHRPVAQATQGAKPTGTGKIIGSLKFVSTDKNNVKTEFDGIITSGTLTLSGKPIGGYTE